MGCGCSERTIYRNYLIGLRKTRKMLNNSTSIENINNLVSILNFTSKFVSNYTIINNTQVGAKNIVMANIILDVSNVREIHIKTNKDVLIVELDKTKQGALPQLLTNVNNIDSILNTLSLLAKLLNIV
jgi:nitrate reductase NapAB chaperone NapD